MEKWLTKKEDDKPAIVYILYANHNRQKPNKLRSAWH